MRGGVARGRDPPCDGCCVGGGGHEVRAALEQVFTVVDGCLGRQAVDIGGRGDIERRGAQERYGDRVKVEDGVCAVRGEPGSHDIGRMDRVRSIHVTGDCEVGGDCAGPDADIRKVVNICCSCSPLRADVRRATLSQNTREVDVAHDVQGIAWISRSDTDVRGLVHE